MTDILDSSADSALASKVVASCKKNWSKHKSDCSGFVKAVAQDVGFTLSGLANAIIDSIASSWKATTDGAQAAALARQGYFVIGGLKDTPNGHVVVVVAGPLNRNKYPTAYWGKLHGVGKQNATINYSWNEFERDDVTYYYAPIQTPDGVTAGRSVNWSIDYLEKAVKGWLGI